MKRYMALAVALFVGSFAGAGEIVVIDDPNPADYHLNEGERLIMVVPSIDATSRYIPPEQAFGGAPRTAAPAVAGAPAVKPVSEVANRTARRSDLEKAPAPAARSRAVKKEPVAQDERVPWWKGGLWRNRDADDGGNNTDRERDAARRNTRDTDDDAYSDPVAARRAPSPDDFGGADEGDMWDNGQGAYDPYGAAVPPQQGGYPPQGGYDPYADPYAAPQQAAGYGYDPYAAPPPPQGGYAPDPYAPQMQGGYATQGGYVSQPFTDPNAPLGAYLDAAYGTVPAVDAGTGAPIAPGTPYPPAPAAGYAADPYAQPYADPYAAPYPPSAPAYTGGISTATAGMAGDPFAALPAAPPPSYAAAPSYDAQGGPQFENAVRMVKENRFTEAKAILASEVQRNPGNAAAWRWLADCHYNLLELDDAIRAYQRSLDQDHGDYYALRGQGFSYLHRGHEYWRKMQEEVGRNQKEAAASTFALAHDDYKKALEMLGLCLRRAPNDGEAIYGEAMAAEGASRKLYSNAISYLKLGPEQRERAELFAENCLTVINKGIEQSKARSKQVPGDSGPRALLGGLYLRKATLYHQLDKNDLALIELRNARDAQRSILDEIDKNNATAQRANQEIESLWEQWGGNA